MEYIQSLTSNGLTVLRLVCAIYVLIFGVPKDGIFEANPRDTDHLHFPGFHPDAAQWLVDNRDAEFVHGLLCSFDQSE